MPIPFSTTFGTLPQSAIISYRNAMETTTLDWATFALLVCTALFTSVLMVGALLTARQARRSADAATETAGMAGSEHDARMRPWVGMVELECEDKDWKVLNTWQMALKNYDRY